MGKVKTIVARAKIDCSHILGQFLDESHFDHLIESDTDCFQQADCDPLDKLTCKTTDCSKCKTVDTTDERKIAFKFRKNYFTKKEQEDAYLGLREAAQQTQNRGLAAGPKGAKCSGRDWVTVEQLHILDYLVKLSDNNFTNPKQDIATIRAQCANKQDTRGLVWLSSEVERFQFKFETWLKDTIKKDPAYIREQASWVSNELISDTTYANPVLSGVAGWYDRYPRIPYGRATSYTRDNYDKFSLAFPFLQSLNRGFKELLPWRHANQQAAANKIDSRFLVPKTVFTTVTVNKTFRTAAHYDAGDLSTGLSNLLVVSNNGRYSGGYLVFPEYRIAVNVRPGDLLLVNNHEILHGNTPIVLEDPEAERISLVCYFREAMLELGSYEYENLRYEFVESRRKNPEHPEWRQGWNGVSSGMWESHEWYTFLQEKNPNLAAKYHPPLTYSSLESLFS